MSCCARQCYQVRYQFGYQVREKYGPPIVSGPTSGSRLLDPAAHRNISGAHP